MTKNPATSAPSHCPDYTFAGHPSPETVFTQLTNCFTHRKSSLSATLGAILTTQGPVDCVAHLSVITQNYTHSGVYAALNRGKVDTDAVVKVAADLGNADPLYADVYSFDTTSWLRPNSFTVDSLGRAHDPQGSKKGEPTQPGWTYSVITRQSHAGGSWSLPSHVARVGNTDDRSVFTAQQISEVVAIHRGRKPVFTGDSGCSAQYLHWLLKKDNVATDLLIRLRSDRVFREAPYEGARPHVKHGKKFHLANPERKPDRSTTFTSARHGEVRVDTYPCSA